MANFSFIEIGFFILFHFQLCPLTVARQAFKPTICPQISGGRAFKKGMTVGVFLFFKNFLATVVLASAAVISSVVSQLSSYTGLRYTLASFSSSLTAYGPTFIFLAACICGMEYVQWTARSFQAKVLGMILMVGGGCIVGFYQGPAISIMHSPVGSHSGMDTRELREDWFRGPLLVLVALAASKNVAAQYGSAIWLSFYITVEGRLKTLAAAGMLEGVVVSGLASFLQITLARMRDPVFAAALPNLTSLCYGDEFGSIEGCYQ